MNRRYLLFILILLVLFAGCIATEKKPNNSALPQIVSPPPSASPAPGLTTPEATIQPTVQQLDSSSQQENYSVAVEVNYREYVDWFRNYNLNIRAYTPNEYICGQYTADMINASAKAGYHAYFAAVTFSDGSGHALCHSNQTSLAFHHGIFSNLRQTN